MSPKYGMGHALQKHINKPVGVFGLERKEVFCLGPLSSTYE